MYFIQKEWNYKTIKISGISEPSSNIVQRRLSTQDSKQIWSNISFSNKSVGCIKGINPGQSLFLWLPRQQQWQLMLDLLVVTWVAEQVAESLLQLGVYGRVSSWFPVHVSSLAFAVSTVFGALPVWAVLTSVSAQKHLVFWMSDHFFPLLPFVFHNVEYSMLFILIYSSTF